MVEEKKSKKKKKGETTTTTAATATTTSSSSSSSKKSKQPSKTTTTSASASSSSATAVVVAKKKGKKSTLASTSSTSSATLVTERGKRLEVISEAQQQQQQQKQSPKNIDNNKIMENPALKEPDAKTIVNRGETAAAPSVSIHRKQELLLQARADRRKWIQKVPLPFVSSTNQQRDLNNVWSFDDRLNHVQSSLACQPQYLPVATKILSELYGLETNIRSTEEVAKRVENLVSPFINDENNKKKPTLLSLEQDHEELLAEAITGKEADNNDNEVVKAYIDFWTTLLKPECALLVQGMRNYLASLNTTSSTMTMERLATSLKTYIDSTFESFKSHVAWKDNCGLDVKRSLESFIYGQAQPILLNSSLSWENNNNGGGSLFSMSEEEWNDRIATLQFVQPSHLEIECLSHYNKNDKENLDIDELLKEPIEALLSIERYYSPFEKLQRILAVYQGVNAALSKALNQNNDNVSSTLTSSSSSSSEQQQSQSQQQQQRKKLPSADDVLPTIILVVLRAKNTTGLLFRTLQFVEIFSPQEYLRGEAGYAYTNLYGAVQFIHDLDMNKLDSLSMSPEEFRKYIQETKKKNNKRLSSGSGGVEEEEKQQQQAREDETLDFSVVPIRARDVRMARLQGENVDLEWAAKRQERYMLLEEYKKEDDGATTNAISLNLPDGFTRQYNFVGTRPEEVRVSDLPQLLNEYRTLVQVTEQLLGERAARLASEKRKKESARSKMLDEAFLGIDESSTANANANASTRDRSMTP